MNVRRQSLRYSRDVCSHEFYKPIPGCRIAESVVCRSGDDALTLRGKRDTPHRSVPYPSSVSPVGGQFQRRVINSRAGRPPHRRNGVAVCVVGDVCRLFVSRGFSLRSSRAFTQLLFTDLASRAFIHEVLGNVHREIHGCISSFHICGLVGDPKSMPETQTPTGRHGLTRTRRDALTKYGKAAQPHTILSGRCTEPFSR